jgi:hypothetical protein
VISRGQAASHRMIPSAPVITGTMLAPGVL